MSTYIIIGIVALAALGAVLLAYELVDRAKTRRLLRRRGLR